MEQNAFYQRLLAIARRRTADIPPRREPPTGDLPISEQQEGVWDVVQRLPSVPAFNMGVALRLRGPVEPAVLERSFNEIVSRHDVLRMTILPGSPRPLARVSAHHSVAVPVNVVRDGTPDGPEAAARRFAADLFRHVFDLSQAPLFRVALFRIGEDDHLFVFVTHHILIGGESLIVFVEELGTLYRAFLENRPSPLREPSRQFADFLQWRQARITAQALEERLAPWRRKLADLPDPIAIGDRPRMNDRAETAESNFALPAALAERLNDFSEREQASFFIVAAASFLALLHARTGRTDIVIGSLATTRPHALRDVMGPFTNMFLVRADLNLAPTFRQLVHRVRDEIVAAFEDIDLPFWKAEEKRIGYLMNQQTWRWGNVFAGTGLTVTIEPVPSMRRHDLCVSLRTQGGLTDTHFHASYDSAQFGAASIQLLFDQYVKVIDQAVTCPDQPLSKLSLG